LNGSLENDDFFECFSFPGKADGVRVGGGVAPPSEAHPHTEVLKVVKIWNDANVICL